MADDKTGWSEKGKRSSGDSDGAKSSNTPSRPSKRDTSKSKGDAESSVVRTPAASDAGARKVAKAAATAGQRDVSFASRLGFPALIALICLLGIGAVVYARSTREALATPRQGGVDHWHAVYGVYSCDTGEYLPAFQSGQDDTGIHSHADGLIHVHPFFELSSGQNAQMRHFISEMNVEITPERISVNNVFDPPVELVAGNECIDGSGTAEIKLLHWDFDIEVRDGSRTEPTVITENFGDVKFDHDREVYVWAYVSEDTDIDDIPLPPNERFEQLDGVSSAIEYDPTGLDARETGIDLDDEGDDADAEGDDADAEADE